MSNVGKPKKVGNGKGNLERWIKIVKNLLGSVCIGWRYIQSRERGTWLS